MFSAVYLLRRKAICIDGRVYRIPASDSEVLQQDAKTRTWSQVSISPSAVSEARIDRRMMCGQAGPARFRYSDLKEAARRWTRALWGLNGMEGWCPGVSSCCRGARKTTADALGFHETPEDRGRKAGRRGKSRL